MNTQTNEVLARNLVNFESALSKLKQGFKIGKESSHNLNYLQLIKVENTSIIIAVYNSTEVSNKDKKYVSLYNGPSINELFSEDYYILEEDKQQLMIELE